MSGGSSMGSGSGSGSGESGDFEINETAGGAESGGKVGGSGGQARVFIVELSPASSWAWMFCTGVTNA